MPDTKITALAAITTVDPAADVLPIVDISDTSMAASGTTKKITSNQILGAGGTATLASATITGDLTVDTSTLKVDSANNRVGIGTASPANVLTVRASDTFVLSTGGSAGFTGYSAQVDSGAGASLGAFANAFGWVGTSTNHYLEIRANNIAQQKIEPLGIFSWYDGAGGTRMTLNANGLGVGASPSYKFHVGGYSSSNIAPDAAIVRSSSGTTIQSGPNLLFSDGVSNNSICLQNSQGRFGIWNYGAGAWNERLSVDANGNCGIGVTPSAWGNAYKVVQTGQALGVYGRANLGYYGTKFNLYNDNTNDVAITTNYVGEYRFELLNGSHVWLNKSSAGTAGVNQTLTQAMTLDASGRLILLASTTTPATLATNGQLTFTATSNTNLRFSYRGSDGVTRTADLTLA